MSQNTHKTTEVEEIHVEDTYGEVGHETAATGEQSLLASLGLNGQLFGFQLINFAVVALIVWFLILKPLTKQLEERKKIIDESLDNAKAVESNLQMSEQKFDEKLAEAKKESNEIVAKAREDAEEQADKLRDKTKTEIESLVTKARGQIEKDKESMRDDLRKETAELVVLALGKILPEKIDPKKDEKLIDEIIKGLAK